MKRRLLIARHAKATHDDYCGADFDRPLNGRGFEDAALVGSKLAECGVSPDFIVSSPAARAIETARIIVPAIGGKIDEILLDSSIYGASPRDLMRIVGAVPDSCCEAIIFGHNPGLEELAFHLCQNFACALKPCAVVCLDFDSLSWSELSLATLAFHLSPSDLRRT